MLTEYNLAMENQDELINAFEAFGLVDIRVGRILRAEVNPQARKPAYKLWIDFGPLGERTSSAQITDLYTPVQLIGRQIVAAVNLGSRLIGGFRSEALVLGAADSEGRVVLLEVEREVECGGKIY